MASNFKIFRQINRDNLHLKLEGLFLAMFSEYFNYQARTFKDTEILKVLKM